MTKQEKAVAKRDRRAARNLVWPGAFSVVIEPDHRRRSRSEVAAGVASSRATGKLIASAMLASLAVEAPPPPVHIGGDR